MDDELARLDEGFLADGASVRSFAGVDAHMTMQFTTVFEGAAAHLASVRSLLRVDPTMHLKVLFDTEHLVAKLALERTLTGVRAVVADQSGGHRESLSAYVAAIRISASSSSCRSRTGCLLRGGGRSSRWAAVGTGVTRVSTLGCETHPALLALETAVLHGRPLGFHRAGHR